MKYIKFILIIFKFLFFLIFIPQNSRAQVISFNMRKIAYSTNQFGLDLLRASSNKNDKKPIVFCPFCISSSLVMLLMGSQNEMEKSLRHALYLNSMSENEINFAYYDMINMFNHLGVNLPTQKQPTNQHQTNFKMPFTSSSGGLNIYNLDLLNKAGLLSSESQTLTLLPNNQHLNNGDINNQQFNNFDSFKNNNYEINGGNGQVFQSYDYTDRIKLNNPFSPYNEHRSNFIKFSQLNNLNSINNLDDQYLASSNLQTDIKTSNYLFGRFNKRNSRAFGFGKNGFWNSKSYLNPFGTMLNAFQNNFQNQFQYATNYPSNYQQNNLVDGSIEKFGQNINHQALNNNNIGKLPNNFYYYNKHMSNKPINQGDNQRLTTSVNLNMTTISANKKSTVSINSTSNPQTTITTTTTESPKQHHSTINHNHHHHNYNPHLTHNHIHNNPSSLNNLDNSIMNQHSVRLGTNHFETLTNYHLNNQNDLNTNDISFLSNIYVQRDFVINYPYHLLLQKFYKTAIHPLDFIHNGEETRHHINSYVEMQTDNKICNILSERQSPATQLLLISALYFKGELDLKLNLTKIKNIENFGDNVNQTDSSNNINYHAHNLTNSSSYKEHSNKNRKTKDSMDDELWMMEANKQRLRYAFDNYLSCSTVEMPFKDSMITLIIMIPNEKDGLDTLITKLNAQTINDVINSLEIKKVSIKLPRINIENNFRNLSMTLAHLGLSDLFRPGHSQLNNISDFKWLYVSDIIHKTKLIIKENSTFENKSQSNKQQQQQQKKSNSKSRTKQDEQTDVINIELNRPFLFFIMDSVSGLIISIGKFDSNNLNKEMSSYRLPV